MEKILKKIVFPTDILLSELDKNQLLFIHFFCSGNFEKLEDINSIKLDNFEKSIKEQGFSFPKKSKNDLIKMIKEMFDLKKVNPVILSFIYNEEIEPDDNNLIILAIDVLAKFLFRTKIIKLCEYISTNNFTFNDNLFNDVDKLIDSFNIKGKVCLNILCLVHLLSIIEQFKKFFEESIDKEELKEKLSEIMEKDMFPDVDYNNAKLSLTSILPYKYVINTKLIYYFKLLNEKEKTEILKENNELIMQLNILNNNLIKQENINKKDKELVKKFAEDKKTLLKELNDFKKSPKNNAEDNEIINKLLDSIKNKDNQIQKLTNDFKNAKEKPNMLYKEMVDNLNKQLVDTKLLIKDKTQEIKELKIEINELTSINKLTIIEEYLQENKLDERLYKIIEPYIEEYNINKEKMLETTSIVEMTPTVEVINKTYDKVGYCIIENNTHYIVLLNGQKEIMYDIPKNIYIGEYQFVLVNNEYRFKWAYPYLHEQAGAEYLISRFGKVVEKADGFYIDSGNMPKQLIRNIPNHIKLKEDDFVSIKNDFSFIRYYKKIPYNASTFIKSTIAKGHKMGFVLNVFPNGLLIREVETEKELFNPIDLENYDIKEQEVVIFEEDKIVTIFKKSNFYTASTLYNKSQCGSVEILHDNVLIKKLTGEIAIVKNIPERVQLEEGQLINVDEFNNFLNINYLPEYTVNSISNNNAKKSSPGNKSYSENRNSIREITKSVAIVGNISYENSYKLSLLKAGYKADVIEGNEPWSKIYPIIKSADIVVVSTEHISHSNMFKIKENILDKIVIYAKYDGANRILEEIQLIEEKEVQSS
ncbi:MAG: hypothetical protein K0R54_590 [Clostridiaceae bacterium]|jgi:hypothetical protein|nr:hypothetical protein [Clostridiaceae bacterium]